MFACPIKTSRADMKSCTKVTIFPQAWCIELSKVGIWLYRKTFDFERNTFWTFCISICLLRCVFELFVCLLYFLVASYLLVLLVFSLNLENGVIRSSEVYQCCCPWYKKSYINLFRLRHWHTSRVRIFGWEISVVNESVYNMYKANYSLEWIIN